MDFGSKYVYNYSDSEEESVSDDEFEEGLDVECGPVLPAPSGRTGVSSAEESTSTGVEATLSVAGSKDAVVSDQVENDSTITGNSSLLSMSATLREESTDMLASLPGHLHLKQNRSHPLPQPVPFALSSGTGGDASRGIKSKKAHHWLSAPSTKQVKESKKTKTDTAGGISLRERSEGVAGGGGSDRRGSGGDRGYGTHLGRGMEAAKKWRRADTNVIAIKFHQLTAPSNMHTGDPVVCINCQVMMSHISKLTEDEGGKIWACEFCSTRNTVDVMPEEIPAQLDVTYMIEPAPATTASGRHGADESLVVFCVDISGSMCVSKQVPGRVNLRGSHLDRYRSLNTEGSDQWMPGQDRNVTYITRLQGLQAAVDHQLEELAKEHPGRRAALVTFNSEVMVVGDGRADPVTVAGDKLFDQEELINIGSSLALPASIKDSRGTLGEKIFDLEEGGQTALGPAMLVSVSLACQVPGSKVIMCTDGMANIGVGSLDKADIPEEHAKAVTFYDKVIEIAKNKGVSVSVLTIAGTDCKLVELGSVANETGGQVNIVDPMKLTREFGNILADPIIASKVVATFFVHKGLYIRGEAEKTSRVVRDVGNVTKQSEVTFEYGVRSTRHRAQEAWTVPEKAQKMSEDTTATGGHGGSAAQGGSSVQNDGGGNASGEGASGSPHQLTSGTNTPTDLPFQVQIRYTDMDGAQAMRVITQTKPMTTDRDLAENYINMPVVGTHAAQQSSRYALEGEYTPSRLNAFMYQRLFARNAPRNSASSEGYEQYKNVMAPFDHQLLQAQSREARASGSTVARYENELGGYIAPPAPPASASVGSRISRLFGGGERRSQSSPQAQTISAPTAATVSEPSARRRACDDETAKEIFSKGKFSSKDFMKPPE